VNDNTALLSEAREILPEMVNLRRDIHAHPELGLDLPRTQAAVLGAIDSLGLEVSTGRSLSSVTAVLDTGRDGPTTLLRADMDALPMSEDTGLDYASVVDGAMHACGHDAHVAMLAGAAQLLRAHDELSGRVVFMFQPGEEGHHGARHMIDEGVLEAGGGVDLAFAIHQTPVMPAGLVATRGGTMLASADVFTVTVLGRGGHASMPHQALDPIPVACEIVVAISSLVTRRVDVFDPAVVTVAHVSAGTTSNVIPERATLTGTIRTVSARTRAQVHADLERLANGIAQAHGATVEFTLVPGFPVTVNDPGTAEWVREVAGAVVGSAQVHEMAAPVMGAEDFSYVLERVPGAMAFLGTCPEGVEFHRAAPNHSNRMVLDESSLATGIALYAAVALERSRLAR
jgi:hippurate hydrolase